MNDMMNKTTYKRAEVWMVELDGIGSEQKGVRPCCIISNEANNKYCPTVQVLTITSQPKKDLPVHVELSAEKHGMPKDCMVLCETITTADKRRFKYKMTTLDEETMEEITYALQVQLGMIDIRKPLINFRANKQKAAVAV